MMDGLYRMASGFLNTVRIVPEPYTPDRPEEEYRAEGYFVYRPNSSDRCPLQVTTT